MSAHATPFTYSESRLTSCATHLLHQSGKKDDCHHLFLAHAAHYRRPPLTNEEEQFWNTDDDNNTIDVNAAPSKRLQVFLNNVVFVYRHNLEGGHHTVGLNRFSDVSLDDLPWTASSTSTNQETKTTTTFSWIQELESSKKAFVTLDSDELILQYAQKFQRKRTVPQQQQQRQQQSYTTLLQQIYSLFHQQSYFQGIFDSWWWIGERHDNNNHPKTTASIEEHSHHSPSHTHTAKESTQGKSFIVDKKNEMDGIDSDNTDDDEWRIYLNWSTDENPDGVGIVHDAMDQVWLFVFLYTFPSL